MSASQSRAADFDQRIEHGLQIERRAADDLEHVGGGGLLLSDSRSSLSSRVFSMAMTAWFGEIRTSSICLSLKGRTSTKNGDCADELVLEHRNGKNGTHAEFPSDGAQPAIIFVSWLRLQIGDLDGLPGLVMRPMAVPIPGRNGACRSCCTSFSGMPTHAVAR